MATLGSQRVRLDFNPNSNTAAGRLKLADAALIDAVKDEPGDGRCGGAAQQEAWQGSMAT